MATGLPENADGRGHPTPVARRRLFSVSSLLVLTLALTLALATAGCDASIETPQNEPVEAEGPERGVPIQVVQGRQGSTMIFVDIYIQGEGPYTFILDTGASSSSISPELVDQLGLEAEGETREITGVTGSAQAELVRITDWRVEDVSLPETVAVAIPLPETFEASRIAQLLGVDLPTNPQGLLGSDVLYQFGVITIDFASETLVLRPDPGTEQ